MVLVLVLGASVRLFGTSGAKSDEESVIIVVLDGDRGSIEGAQEGRDSMSRGRPDAAARLGGATSSLWLARLATREGRALSFSSMASRS